MLVKVVPGMVIQRPEWGAFELRPVLGGVELRPLRLGSIVSSFDVLYSISGLEVDLHNDWQITLNYGWQQFYKSI